MIELLYILSNLYILYLQALRQVLKLPDLLFLPFLLWGLQDLDFQDCRLILLVPLAQVQTLLGPVHLAFLEDLLHPLCLSFQEDQQCLAVLDHL